MGFGDLDWPWICFVNVPVGIVILVTLPALVPGRAAASRRDRCAAGHGGGRLPGLRTQRRDHDRADSGGSRPRRSGVRDRQHSNELGGALGVATLSAQLNYGGYSGSWLAG
jgi:hypothetical protein